MLFNPIFINPQKFLTTPETSGVKQNKLSYLFSDIIKNSLGVKTETKESNLETETASNIISDHVSKENLRVNSFVELTDDEKSIISELNSIIANFHSSATNTFEKTETVKIGNSEHEEIKITGDDESLDQLLHGLVNLIEKHELHVEASSKEMPENIAKEFKGADLKNILPALKKIINELHPDKQLQVTVKVGGENIDLNVTKPKLESGSPITENNLPEQKNKNTEAELKVNVETNKDVIVNPTKTESTIKVSQASINSTNENKNDLATSLKNTSSSEQITNAKKAEINIKTNEVVSTESKPTNIIENAKSVNTHISKFNLAVKISEVKPSSPEKAIIKSVDAGIEDQTKLVYERTSKISFNIAKVPIIKAAAEGSVEVKPKPEIKIENAETNTPINKLIQSIKKIDNNMLKQDIVPRQIKFNPVAVDEIKNQKFQLLNLSSAVRTIKSLSKPSDEQTVNNTFKLNTKNSFEKNDVSFNIKTPKAGANFQQDFKLENKFESVKEVLPNTEKEVKQKTESELKLSSIEILSGIKSSSKAAEIKELKEFLSTYKNEKLTIKVAAKEPEVKFSTQNPVKPNINVKPVKQEIVKPMQQKEAPVKQFEIDFGKFEKALKEKGGSKSIREFISSNDKPEKSKIIIEPVKANAAEKVSEKITEAAKVISKESLKAAHSTSLGKEEVLSKEAPKINEVRSTENQKEIKVESSLSSENKTAANKDNNSAGKQSEQNNFSKGAVESDKYQAVNKNENISEELKNVNIGQSAEAVQSSQSSELNVTAKQMPEMVRDVKAADIYKELYKIIEKKEHQSITLQVIPKKLGRVKVVVDIVDQMVQTKIEVENESAKQLLQNNMDALKHSLNQSGIQLSNYSVSLSSSNNKTYRPLNSKKKETGNDEPENTDNENMPVSGKKMGYNTYEYLI